MIWKKKQSPLQHIQHDTSHERIRSLEARIARLEAQPTPPITLYKLEAGEDVLVQCLVGDEWVCVPLSQIIAQVMPEIITQIEQAMVAKVKIAGPSRSRAMKATKQQSDHKEAKDSV